MYTINITEKAIEQLKKLPKVIQPKLAKKIDELATNPFPASAKKLKGFHALYRIRFKTFAEGFQKDGITRHEERNEGVYI